MREALRVVGKRLPKVDAIEKVTGSAKFTADMRLPGMLYGKVLRSPYAHAKVLRVDTSEAEKLPGVKAVLTIKDVPRIKYDPSDPLQSSRDQYIFDEKVRYVGEGVAAVAAVSEDAAEEALKLIRVDYEELPAVFDPAEAMKPDVPKIHPVERNIASHVPIAFGDVEKGFKEADYVFENRYVASRQKHCHLEPHACVVRFDYDRKITVWSSTQSPFRLRFILAKALDMPLGKIRVIAPHVGGGFGNKLYLGQHELVCTLLAKKTGRPVKIRYTRKEEFYTTTTRHPAIIELKTGVKKDGTLTAIQAKVIMNTGAYALFGSGVTWVACYYIGGSSLYRCPNIKVDGYCVYTNTPAAGAMRAFGGPQAHFAVESHMDMIAENLGIDPVELRLKNLVRIGDVDRLSGFYNIRSCGLRECIEKGAERIGWKKKEWKHGGVNEARKRGMGMACMSMISELGVSAAFVKLNEDGSVNILTGATDIGQGSNTVLAQIVAEELGVRLEDVTVTSADTNLTPFDWGTLGSRITYIAGSAAKAAAADAKRQLLERAAKMLKADVKNLEIRDGRVYVKGSSEKGASISEVVWFSQYVDEAKAIILGRASYGPSEFPPAFGAHFAEVEVNTETGQVKVLRIVAVHDVGRAINPTLVEGQVEGALQMGIGYALTEELLFDKVTGKPLNPSFLDYKILTAKDMPEIEVIIIEPVDPTGPYGAKAVGEAACIPTAAAIANAVYNAIGIRCRELPITPEKILKALKSK